MNSDKLKMLNFAAVVIMLAAIIGDVYAIINSTPDFIWITLTVIQILIGIFAIYYTLAGCKKIGGANMFIMFMIFFAIYEALMIIFDIPKGILDILFITIAYGCICVFATAKNIGKQKSLAMAIIVSVFSLCSLLVGLSVCGDILFVMNRITTFVISLYLILMVVCKYSDKTVRGSK